MTTLLARKAQVAGKVEAVEGVAETLTGAEALLVYDVAFTPDVSSFSREPVRSTLSRLPSIRGVKLGTLAFRAELKGSGSVATAPEWAQFLKACGFVEEEVKTIAIGAIAGGPFQAGERITGGTSNAVGRVVGDRATGAATLRYVVISGVFQNGEVVTGATSTATTTTAGVPVAAQGFAYRPTSSSIPSLTLALYLDGIRHLLVGARGNVTISANAGEPGFLAFSFQGVYSGTADVALLVPTYDAVVPPSFLNVGFAFDDGFSPCFTALSVELGNVLEPRRCARATDGVVSVLLTNRAPSATIDPELDLVAGFDYFGKMRSGDEGRFACSFGSVAGNVVVLASPKVQIEAIGPGDRNGIAIGNLTLRLSTASVDAGDDELQVAVV